MRRVLLAAALAVLPCLPAAAQPRVDYSKLEIKTTDLGHGVYLLGWQGGDSLNHNWESITCDEQR